MIELAIRSVPSIPRCGARAAGVIASPVEFVRTVLDVAATLRPGERIGNRSALLSMDRTNSGLDVPLNLDALAFLYSRVPFQLARVDQIADSLFAAQLTRKWLTPAQLDLLWLLKERGTLIQTDLSNLSGYDKSTIGLIVSNLLRHGVIDRATDMSDRRRKLVSITALGTAATTAGWQALLGSEQRLLKSLSEVERTSLVQMLQVIADANPLPEASGELHGTVSWLVGRGRQLFSAAVAVEPGLFGLTPRQSSVLHVVLAHPGISESGIRRLLGLEVSNNALITKLLLSKGLISFASTSSATRRRYQVTRQGGDVLRAVEPKLAGLERSQLSGLSSEQADRLRVLLASLMLDHAAAVKARLEALDIVSQRPLWPASTVAPAL